MNATESGVEITANLFSHVDYFVFGALLLCSVAIGLYFGICNRQKQTTEEYLHGSHRMQVVPIAISLVTSTISAWTIMAVPAEIYSFGWLYILLIPAMVFLTLAANYLFIPVFYQNSIDNCYTYLEMRFSKCVRNIVSITAILHLILYIPITLYLPSLALSEVSGHGVHTVNAVVCCSCVIYTMLGGIKAIVWTDVVQGGVMFLSMVLIAFFGVEKVGGLSEVWNRAVAGGRVTMPDFTLDLMTRQTFWNMILGNFAIMTWNICFDQKSMQRIIALPTLSHSRQSITLFAVGMCFVVILTCFTGIIMYAYYQDCDPIRAKIVSKSDKMIPHFVQEIVGDMIGMPGIFISCVFSASLSTVSVILNTLAGILYSDFFRPLKIIRHSEQNAKRLMKIIIVLLGIVSVLGGIIIEKLSSSFQAMFIIAGVCNGAIVGVFTIGMLYPWVNRHGAIYGVMMSMIVLLFIISNTQIAIGEGELHYDPLPTSIDGCSNETFVDDSVSSITNTIDDTFAFYKISFMWYGPLGIIVTWITGIVVSHFTGGQDLNELDLNLLAPCIQNLLPEKYRHKQLHVITEQQPLEPEDCEKL